MAKLYFNFGAMNAGKSTILLQAAYNYHERGMRTVILKPVIDDRGGARDQVSSRIGLSADAHAFGPDVNVGELISAQHKAAPLDCVLVDEAQFLTADQVWQLAAAADDLGIPVMCYGLRTDFRGDLFPGSAALLAIADNLREIKTLCWCGRKATLTLRFDGQGKPIDDGTQIQIGGNERYISLCRRHWRARARRPE